MEREELHVALFPFVAFGHMTPFLHLGIALAEAGLRISFLCTPRNIRRLPKVPPHLTSSLRIVELTLPRVDGLPEHAEATMDIPVEKHPLLVKAYYFLSKQVQQFLVADTPDYLLHDILSNWVPPIAQATGVPCIFFSALSAVATSFIGGPIFGQGMMTKEGTRLRLSPERLTSPPEWFTFPSTIALRPWEAEQLSPMISRTQSRKQVDRDGYCAVAIRSCREYEGQYLELLEKLWDKPVIPVGLIPPKLMPVAGSRDREIDGDGGQMFRWLNGQQPKSVLFVSFGSEYNMTKDEVHELARGLELAMVPFLWVFRRPSWVTGADEEALPEGYRSRNRGHGVVIIGWVPQLEILAHPAIGGSLFHSGWGSVIETLRHGHVLVIMPAVYDQGLNARLLVEKKLAIEVERSNDGSFSKHGIAEALRMAMLSEEGEELRENARAMGAVFADQKLQEKYVKNFVEFLRKARNHGFGRQSTINALHPRM